MVTKFQWKWHLLLHSTKAFNLLDTFSKGEGCVQAQKIKDKKGNKEMGALPSVLVERNGYRNTYYGVDKVDFFKSTSHFKGFILLTNWNVCRERNIKQQYKCHVANFFHHTVVFSSTQLPPFFSETNTKNIHRYFSKPKNEVSYSRFTKRCSSTSRGSCIYTHAHIHHTQTHTHNNKNNLYYPI